MNKQNLLNPEITFYIRTAKKLGFIQKSKKSTLSEKELKQIAQKRSKIPVQNQILYFNGEQVKQDKDVSLSEKSIVHVVDSRNVGKSKMKLLFKRLPQNSQADTFEVDSNTSIDHFIKKQLQPFYSQPAEKLFFVYSGRQLKREKSFSQEHVECDTEIICVHEDKDRKNKKSTNSAKSSAKSLKTKDTETKLEQKLVEQKQHENQSKPQNNQVNSQERKIEIPSEVLIQKEKEKTQQNVETQEKISKLYVQASPSEQTQSIEKHQKEEKKLIKSIEEIECNQLESDEDSDNENQQDQQNAYPKKLPEQFLMQQTRPRSHTKSSNNNNSETSSISEPNFKKKKKVSQIQTIKQNYVTTSQKQKQDDLSPRLHRDDSEGKEQSHSPKSLNQQFQQNDRVNEQKQKGTQELNTETPNSQKLNELLKPRVIKTREQIFQSNANTYSSVIDEPEDFSSSSQNQREKQANPSTNQTDPSNKDVFASYFNHHEEEVYNSQLNSHYYQTDSQSLEVKYNKGFMNFSNASFLEPSKIQSRIQTHINDPSYQNDKHQSHIGTNFVDQSRHQNFTIEHRPPEYLNSYFNEHQETHEQSQRKQSGHAIQFYNDSLSFSKQQSEFRHNDESEDNLFVQHRRGHQRNNKSKPHEISESNLLSQTFHNPNLTDHMMNSITFNLEPDEQVSTFKQSDIHIVPEEDDLQENALVSDGKRQSQIQTNFRDSANPSQICSNSSQIHINNVPAQNMQSNLIEPMSLIENLMSMVDYKINVNSVESEDSDDEERKNFVNQQSDIECQKSIQEHKSVNLFENNENQPSKMLLEEQSNVFVQYQSYRADIDSEVIEFVKDKLQASKSYQSNLLQDCSLANNLQTSQQGHSYRKNINNDSQIHQIKPKQSSAIKIVEQESIVDSQPQNNWTDKLESNEITEQNMDSESVQCSGAFHEVSEAQGNEESNFLIDNNQNNEAMDQEQITFRKDFKASQSKMESVQGSKLLYQLSLQAQYETEQPQLLPGDYIYSTDRVDAPVETLDAILASFKHCL